MRSLFVTSLESAATTRGAAAGLMRVGGVPKQHIAAFFRSFATLVRAGVPIDRSLAITVEQCGHGLLREALACTVNDIENGLALSAAMSRHPKEFSPLCVTMIRAGELGGVLDEVLLNLACVVERDRSVRQRMMSALAYPGIVALSALALVVFLVTSIVPTFRSMYAQMHVPLPWITQAVIAAGDSLRSPMLWMTLLPLGAGLAIAIARLRGSTRGALLIDGIVMRSPILGAIVRKANLARLARTLGTLLQCGVALVAALEVAVDVVSSAPYRESLFALRQALGEGSGITQPLAACGIYDPMFVQMVRVGEESGALDAMMLHIAEHYEADVDTALSALGSTLEPVMILMLGGAVGFIVAAIFIPLYTLIGNIK